ncbi:chitin deacetylase [Mortierella alpina]|uniref:Chitin deacetylase n=1 Tax=Mortierella alpina TaxID=64518 RepID=A0A9P6IYB3_MORAP|nr:chitin deacetylase [Mortierella alpina]
MVRFLTPFSLAVVLLTLAIGAAAAFSINDYPKPKKLVSIYHPRVQQWLKEIDLTGAPDIALGPVDPTNCTIRPTPAPEENTTEPLLDFLKAHNLKATFFVMGSNAIQFPEVLRREVAEGHHLASHTWSHHALTTLTNEEIVAEMKWTEQAIYDITGIRPKYMRAPYGDIDARVRFVLRKLGLIPVGWEDDFDTKDWNNQMSDAEVVTTFTGALDKYVAGNKTRGFYCLEHDMTDVVVNRAYKLVPLGWERNIQYATVAQCQNDSHPYQDTAMMSLSQGVALTSTWLALAAAAVVTFAAVLM